MNSFQIWIKAQWYNILIGILISVISTIYQLIQKDNLLDNDLGIFFLIFIFFIFFSFVGGMPLMGLFKLTQFGIENSTLNNPSKRFLEKIIYPFGTFFYLVLLSFLLSFNTLEHVYYLETLTITSPAVISTFISVLYNQYQIKKNIENENNILKS